MKIANNIIKEHLKNVYFLCGGAYGGKTTMARLLEEKHGFIRYRQGDHYDESVPNTLLSVYRHSSHLSLCPPVQAYVWRRHKE